MCRALRADPGTATTAILIVSAWASTGDVQADRDAGADDDIVKPFRNDEIFTRAEALVRRDGQPARRNAP